MVPLCVGTPFCPYHITKLTIFGRLVRIDKMYVVVFSIFQHVEILHFWPQTKDTVNKSNE